MKSPVATFLGSMSTKETTRLPLLEEASKPSAHLACPPNDDLTLFFEWPWQGYVLCTA